MTNNDFSPEEEQAVWSKLVGETARIGWRELQKFFAAGRVVEVDVSLDLVKVAAALAEDNKAQFEHWIAQQQVEPMTDKSAAELFEQDATVWAVAVAPWVLVQRERPDSARH